MMDAQGNLIKQFNPARLAAELAAAVGQGGPWGIVDAEGTLIKPLEPAMLAAEQGVAILQAQQWGLMNRQGYVIKQFNPDTPSAEVLVAVQQGDKWGVIDAQGNYFKASSDRTYPIAEGFVLSEGLVAVGGIEQVEVRFLWGLIENDELMDLWGLIDAQGNYLFKPQFTEIRPLAEGWTAVRLLRLHLLKPWWLLGFEVGSVDAQGNHLVEFDVDERPSEGWDADLEWEGPRQWGIIDAKGNYIFEPQFDEIGAFADGFAVVKQDGKWGVIDMKGHYVVEPLFDGLGSFTPYTEPFPHLKTQTRETGPCAS